MEIKSIVRATKLRTTNRDNREPNKDKSTNVTQND